MGVIDYVQLPFTCPKCGHSEPAENRVWQTKSLDPALVTHTPGDTVFLGPRTGRDGDIEMRALCSGCRQLVIAFALIKKGKLTSIIEFPKSTELEICVNCGVWNSSDNTGQNSSRRHQQLRALIKDSALETQSLRSKVSLR